MTTPDFTSAVWRKSTWSGDNGGACVEVALLNGGTVALRDSKDKGNGQILLFTVSDWGAFIAGTSGGEYTRP